MTARRRQLFTSFFNPCLLDYVHCFQILVHFIVIPVSSFRIQHFANPLQAPIQLWLLCVAPLQCYSTFASICHWLTVESNSIGHPIVNIPLANKMTIREIAGISWLILLVSFHVAYAELKSNEEGRWVLTHEHAKLIDFFSCNTNIRLSKTINQFPRKKTPKCMLTVFIKYMHWIEDSLVRQKASRRLITIKMMIYHLNRN